MAVRKSENSDENRLILEFDNGDKIKLEEVMSSWNFKDEESLLRFAMVVFSSSIDKKTLAYFAKDGLQKVQPVDDLLNLKTKLNTIGD